MSRKEILIQSAIRAVSHQGLEGIQIRRICEDADVSVGTLYQYFVDKEGLLQACFEYVDRQIAGVLSRIEFDGKQLLSDPKASVRSLWEPYYRWLVEHPDETVFYQCYKDNPKFPEYEKTRDISYFAAFIRTVQMYQLVYHIDEKVDSKVMWHYILNTTIMFARHVIMGDLPDTDKTQDEVFAMVFGGLNALVAAPAAPQTDITENTLT